MQHQGETPNGILFFALLGAILTIFIPWIFGVAQIIRWIATNH